MKHSVLVPILTTSVIVLLVTGFVALAVGLSWSDYINNADPDLCVVTNVTINLHPCPKQWNPQPTRCYQLRERYCTTVYDKPTDICSEQTLDYIYASWEDATLGVNKTLQDKVYCFKRGNRVSTHFLPGPKDEACMWVLISCAILFAMAVLCLIVVCYVECADDARKYSSPSVRNIECADDASRRKYSSPSVRNIEKGDGDPPSYQASIEVKQGD